LRRAVTNDDMEMICSTSTFLWIGIEREERNEPCANKFVT